MKRFSPFLLTLAAILSVGQSAYAQGRTVARLFWQDDENADLCYGDLKKSSAGWSITRTSVEGFPQIDPAEQMLVQMQADQGVLLIGVRDLTDGSIGSGWVSVDSGAVEEAHGDHSHWYFNKAPSVMQSRIDPEQGNPAHVYQYGKQFVIANDAANGFTTTSAKALKSAKTPESATTFRSGGNGHITLAVVPQQVAYATWIAREGDDCGRVDVVGLGTHDGKRYSIHCPTGGLHGATTNSGKVFFAPTDGICWVEADVDMDDVPEDVQINHLSLGEDASGNPLRTGAFSNLDNHVMFVTGKGNDAKLCWINAESGSPKVGRLAIELSDGASLSTPIAVKSRKGKRLAVLFGEHKETPENDSLVVVELDPNNDGDFSDAVVRTSIDVGRNQIVGHSGHHGAVMLPYGRELAVTNPGDGTISIISLDDFKVTATIEVEGTPTRILAIGG